MPRPTNLAAALIADLDEDDLAELAERLRPHLSGWARTDELLDANAAAETVKLHPRTLVRAARDGRVVGARRVGGRWRFRRDILDVLPVEPSGPRHRSSMPQATRRPQTRVPNTVADAIRSAGRDARSHS